MIVDNIYRLEPIIYKTVHVILHIIKLIKSVFLHNKNKFGVVSSSQKSP